MAGNSSEPGRSVTSKVAAILMSFTSGRGHALVDLARQAGLPTSTAHRLARELTDRHLLERTEDGEFRAGLPLRMLSGETAAPPTLHERAPFVVDDLCEATRATAQLGVLDDLEVAYIERQPGFRPVSTFSAAARLPVHATALGKALLAFAPAQVVRMVLGPSLSAFTPATLTNPEQHPPRAAVRPAARHGDELRGAAAGPVRGGGAGAGRAARRSRRWASTCPTWSRRRSGGWCRRWCWRPVGWPGNWPSTRASSHGGPEPRGRLTACDDPAFGASRSGVLTRMAPKCGDLSVLAACGWRSSASTAARRAMARATCPGTSSPVVSESGSVGAVAVEPGAPPSATGTCGGSVASSPGVTVWASARAGTRT